MIKLNTTREEREDIAKYGSDQVVCALVAGDANTIEDELARVREKLEQAVYVAALKINAAEKERDKLRERLESAEEVIALAERVENLLDKEEWKPITDAPEGPMSMPWNDYWDLGELETLLHFALKRYREGGRDHE